MRVGEKWCIKLEFRWKIKILNCIFQTTLANSFTPSLSSIHFFHPRENVANLKHFKNYIWKTLSRFRDCSSERYWRRHSMYLLKKLKHMCANKNQVSSCSFPKKYILWRFSKLVGVRAVVEILYQVTFWKVVNFDPRWMSWKALEIAKLLAINKNLLCDFCR